MFAYRMKTFHFDFCSIGILVEEEEAKTRRRLDSNLAVKVLVDLPKEVAVRPANT